MEKIIKSDRQQEVLEYALNVIKESEIGRYVSRAILYGSCARGEEKWDSDVDLFVVLEPEFENHLDELRTPLRILQGSVMTDDYLDPETDMKIVIGNEWESRKDLYYDFIRKEGKDVWE